ncbi:hypothetical protein ACHAWF_007583 [Thalassiosira exigua]
MKILAPKLVAPAVGLPLLISSSAASSDGGAAAPRRLHPKFRSHLNCPYADRWLEVGAEQAGKELELGHDHHARSLAEDGSEDGGFVPPPPAAEADGDVDSRKCLLAPGAIGGGHQSGSSTGYGNSCPEAPARESPYMWPLSWSADFEQHYLQYGSDEVVYHGKGKVFYKLDRNWKRSDMTYEKGVLRSINQGPCYGPNSEFKLDGCPRDMTDGSMHSLVHREGTLYFVSWKNDPSNPAVPGELDVDKIEECSSFPMPLVGNLRPDFFMDKRGDMADVQYLADGDVPKLVKQWRKQDFAGHYFVMSMMANTPNFLAKDPNASVEDNIHWPLTINLPGEGIGDDAIQNFKNHELIDDDDVDVFNIIEAYKAAGGACPEVEGHGQGPLTQGLGGEEGKLRSNLERDDLAWVSKEVTFSPYEQATKEEPSSGSSTASSSSHAAVASKAVLEVSDRLTAETCYDEAIGAMDMSFHFHDIEPTEDGRLPWMAIGYRADEACSMTPAGGGNTPMVMLSQRDASAPPQVVKAELVPDAKTMNPSAYIGIYMTMVPLGGLAEYDEVSVELPEAPVRIERQMPLGGEDTVALNFRQTFDREPEVLNLIYAIGDTPGFGPHRSRGCFQVQVTPCFSALNESGNEENHAAGSKDEITMDLGEVSAASPANAKSFGVTSVIGAFAMTGLFIMG